MQKTPIDTLISGSESDENVDDLLTEYQHHLDRAHKQRINYLEKSKTKNKVPLIRHDRFTRTKPGMGGKYDDYYYANGYYNPNKFVQTSFNPNPLDIFLPLNPKINFGNDLTTAKPKENHEDFGTFQKRILELPPLIPKTRYEPIKSSCYCKAGQIPCDCKCKTCLISYDTKPKNYDQEIKSPFDADIRSPSFLPYFEYGAEDRLREVNDNMFNIKVKVDIQLPKLYDISGYGHKNRSREEDGYSKESISPVNIPFPYFNFPIPLEVFGRNRNQKFNKHETAPLHRIIIHKKKKSRLSNNNKKHRKKFVTLKIQPNFDDKMTSNSPVYHNQTENFNVTTFVMQTTESSVNNSNITNTTTDLLTANETQADEGIYVMVNISNTSEKGAEDIHKIENSLETEFPKHDANIAMKKLANPRHKREASSEKPIISNTTELPGANLSQTTTEQVTATITTNTTIPSTKATTTKPNEPKKSDQKGLIADAELLYWPNHSMNQSVVLTKNITTIIYERENKKGKLNMTTEAIRNNRTKALEKAIFGEANWDDVDTVAPVFMSFVGKYLRGALTFCSQNICHSMNCAKKTCVHRTCMPNERWNQRGHCIGTNNTGKFEKHE